MFEEITLNSKYYYHNMISIIMVFVWIIFAFKGYKSTDEKFKYRVSIWIIGFCLIQEVIDFINRIFLDSVYTFSIQRDLPFLQFCQISFYFTLICLFLSNKTLSNNGKYSVNHFFYNLSIKIIYIN